MYCCYICLRAINSFNLNKGSTKVQILTAFLFHSLHHVALRITLTSITCLPLQGLSTVNSVCPLGFNIGIPPALTTIPLKLLLSQQGFRKLCLIFLYILSNMSKNYFLIFNFVCKDTTTFWNNQIIFVKFP